MPELERLYWVTRFSASTITVRLKARMDGSHGPNAPTSLVLNHTLHLACNATFSPDTCLPHKIAYANMQEAKEEM